MPSESVRGRTKRNRYTVIIVPETESQRTRTFSISKLGLTGALVAGIVVLVLLIFAAIIFTPIGDRLPVSNPELQKRYGDQIAGIQQQLQALGQEMGVLRRYNLRLRKALGEGVSMTDSMHLTPEKIDSLQQRAGQDMVRQGKSTLGVVEFGGAVQGRLPEGVEAQLGLQQNALQKELRRHVGFPLVLPADGYLTRGFDVREDHYGVDIAGRPGSAVLAAADGNVVFAGWTYDAGFTMMIAHSEGFMTVYKHNQSILQNTGSTVKRGELIALLGNTGNTSSGPHLHFEVWKDGIADDPTKYLLTTQ